jgi:hypothetical protein
VLKRPQTSPRWNLFYRATAPSAAEPDRHHHDWVAGDVALGAYKANTVSRDYQTRSRTVKQAHSRVL